MYAQFHGLETRVRETLGTKEAGLFSIRKLTEEFVTGQYHLQDRGQAGGGSGAGRGVSGVQGAAGHWLSAAVCSTGHQVEQGSVGERQGRDGGRGNGEAVGEVWDRNGRWRMCQQRPDFWRMCHQRRLLWGL